MRLSLEAMEAQLEMLGTQGKQRGLHGSFHHSVDLRHQRYVTIIMTRFDEGSLMMTVSCVVMYS
jgi:hypothetical protein